MSILQQLFRDANDENERLFSFMYLLIEKEYRNCTACTPTGKFN